MPDNIVVANNFEPIPRIFYPEGKEEPFSHCKICGKELLDAEEAYIVEKIFKQDVKSKKREIIFEFAYCLPCLQGLREEMSGESLQKMMEFFENKSKLKERAKGLRDNNIYDVDLWVNNCIVTNESIDEVEEFQLYAQCQGRDMLFYEYPYMISGKALDEVVNLISNKTLDFLNNFMLDNIDLPPEVEDLFNKTKRPVII
ncbi:MAG: hypothetical protein MI922_12730 [Bacteroidales bacterium]|nr:hypothetical protein [Bacteroidales bacterium]